jgi:hypothetical protein
MGRLNLKIGENKMAYKNMAKNIAHNKEINRDKRTQEKTLRALTEKAKADRQARKEKKLSDSKAVLEP